MEERVFTYFVCLFFFTKYAQERVLSIAKRGRLTKVIPLKIFLDIVTSSSEDVTRAMRGQPKRLPLPSFCRVAQ